MGFTIAVFLSLALYYCLLAILAMTIALALAELVFPLFYPTNSPSTTTNQSTISSTGYRSIKSESTKINPLGTSASSPTAPPGQSSQWTGLVSQSLINYISTPSNIRYLFMFLVLLASIVRFSCIIIQQHKSSYFLNVYYGYLPNNPTAGTGSGSDLPTDPVTITYPYLSPTLTDDDIQCYKYNILITLPSLFYNLTYTLVTFYMLQLYNIYYNQTITFLQYFLLLFNIFIFCLYVLISAIIMIASPTTKSALTNTSLVESTMLIFQWFYVLFKGVLLCSLAYCGGLIFTRLRASSETLLQQPGVNKNAKEIIARLSLLLGVCAMAITSSIVYNGLQIEGRYDDWTFLSDNVMYGVTEIIPIFVILLTLTKIKAHLSAAFGWFKSDPPAPSPTRQGASITTAAATATGGGAIEMEEQPSSSLLSSITNMYSGKQGYQSIA